MSLLRLSDISFGYSSDRLFSRVTFEVERGERAGLVAPNGAGKSTLLRIVGGEIEPDGGTVQIDRGASLSFYRQSHEHGAEGTARDALLSGFADALALRHALDEARTRAESGEAAALRAFAEATDRYEAAGAGALEHRVEAIASRLGFSRTDLSRPLASLSGGERGRLRLGAALAEDTDLLLLDEPTNHLDLDTIRWLEAELRGRRAGMLVVSHDRAFLDAATTATIELGETRCRVYPVSYSGYLVAREADLERERKLAEEQSKEIARTEEFIRKNIAGQKTKQAQSRRRMLDKVDRLGRPEDIWAEAEKVRFRFAETPRSGDLVLETKGVRASRGGRTLVAGFDLLLKRGDRLGVVGPNGCGKTTLLRILAGLDEPEAGSVKRGAALREAYFDQHLGALDEKNSCIEEIRAVRADKNEDATREYLARFRFFGDAPFHRVASLSGGERSRLALAKMLLEPRNLLFLDEPTNHLDIPAAEILEEALTGFEGTVVLVSHDRRFLENVTTRVAAFEGTPTPTAYEGGFGDYQAAGGRPVGRPPSRAPEPQVGKVNHEARRTKAREIERLERRAKELERQLEEAETRLRRLEGEVAAAPGDDWEGLSRLHVEEQTLRTQISRWLDEWTEVSETLGASEPQP